jgi:uncharacterized protein (DUF1501 family)
MNRRNFLQYLSSSMVLPVSINGFGAKSLSHQSPFVQALLGVAEASDKILVVIQMQGGNDGLNMVIPIDQMGTYRSLRSNIAVAESLVLPLAGNPATGLHPAMVGLHQLYSDGKLSVIQGVSYPNPSQSHFRASDIYMTAVDSNQNAATGWLGRYIENTAPNYPIGYPTSTITDPLAIQIGSVVATSVLGPKGSTAVVFKDPNEFARLVGDSPNNPTGDLPPTPYGELVGFVRQQQISTIAYADRITDAAALGKNAPSVTYPSNSLAEQLKIVARLIDGGLQTKLYYVSYGGFDTHASQTGGGNNNTGRHADLLGALSSAISAFMADLKAQGHDGRVAGMTFSEFGRRADSNASGGTDHGLAAPMFVFGNGVRTQRIGTNPNLSSLVNSSIPMQHDFRQVYASILQDWFGADSTTTSSVLFRSFTTLPIFRSSSTRVATAEVETSVFPNPSSDYLVVESATLQSIIHSIDMIDMSGRSVSVPSSRMSDTSIRVEVQQLPTGRYVLDIQSDKGSVRKKVEVVH